MLLNTFEYLKPASLGEALSVLDDLKDKKTQVLAGGTDLIPWLRGRVKDVDYLVDLADRAWITSSLRRSQARIGALVTFAALCEHPELRLRLPAIAEAALQVGAVQTRNQATIGGNLCSAVPSLDGAPALLVLGANASLAGARQRAARSHRAVLPWSAPHGVAAGRGSDRDHRALAGGLHRELSAHGPPQGADLVDRERRGGACRRTASRFRRLA